MKADPGPAAYLTAQAAASELGVSLATLYAYVSRGQVRSESVPGSRAKRYLAEDVRALKRGRAPDAQGLAQSVMAPGAPLAYGLPVLDSAITLIANGNLYYRGVLATDLATSATLEEVAGLLWNATEDPFDRRADPYPGLPDLPSNLDFAERAMALLPVAQAQDPSAYTATIGALTRTGARIMTLLAAIAADRPWSPAPVHKVLADAWAPGQPGAERLIRAALVLMADHELNVSAFTLRCAMSARAPLHAAIAAALAALQGPRHGGFISLSEGLLDDVMPDEDVDQAVARLRRRLKRGDAIPGFGHPLYPRGDPRARALLSLMREVQPRHPTLGRALALVRAVDLVAGEKPNLDFAVAAMSRLLGLATGTGVALFGVARCAGWVAHAIEQVSAPDLIRPRARYVGPPPKGADRT